MKSFSIYVRIVAYILAVAFSIVSGCLMVKYNFNWFFRDVYKWEALFSIIGFALSFGYIGLVEILQNPKKKPVEPPQEAQKDVTVLTQLSLPIDTPPEHIDELYKHMVKNPKL